MHPAYSVIFFTTASGAGYGLVVWLAALAAFAFIPTDRGLGLVGLTLAVTLITSGLLSSTLHLGRPERFWRAFSQWRSSWLSREGIAAAVTYVPLGLLGLGWVVFGTVQGPWILAAGLAAVFALVTVGCTGMIYQSLPPIRAWAMPMVTPIYLLLALTSGAVLALFLSRLFGVSPNILLPAAAVLLALSVLSKIAYWRAIDALSHTANPTGLERFGCVRLLESPNTQPNFVMREMGYRIARAHARKLRALVLVCGLALPGLATLLSMATGTVTAILLASLSVVALAFGLVVERWLFFAEARHVSSTYY